MTPPFPAISRPWARRIGFTLFAVVSSAAVILGGRYLGPLGLSAVCSIDEPVPTSLSPQVQILDLRQACPPGVRSHFEVDWAGFLWAPRSGVYHFATTSDDGSRLYVDRKLVVDNWGSHSPVDVVSEIPLDTGAHSFYLAYRQDTGGTFLAVDWTIPGGPRSPIPAWVLSPRSLPAWAWSLRPYLTGSALVVALLDLIAGLVLVLPAVGRLAGSTIGWPRWSRRDPWLLPILAAGLILFLGGIWWGLPGRGWAPDEIVPEDVLAGLSQGFSHGWYSIYPPFHYCVIAAAYLPFIALSRTGLIDLAAGAPYAALHLLARLVSVAMGLGIIVATYVLGREIHGRQAGLCAAALGATVLPFVFYAKLANTDVPYVFWLAISLVFYTRIVQHDDERSYYGFAAMAALAVCTKDQAYGFYGLPIVHVVAARFARLARASGSPMVARVFDKRLVGSFLVGLGLFTLCQNLWFDLDGFRSHLALITGGASVGYRQLDNTVAGQLGLLSTAGSELVWCLTWPVLAAAAVGIAVVAARRSERKALWLLLPIVSYYATFIAVVGYHYDRFFLGVCVVLAVFAGRGVAQLLATRGRRWLEIGALGLVSVYLVWRAASIDLMMAGDSRYEVQRWLETHAGVGTTVAAVGHPGYLPWIARMNWESMPASVETLLSLRPDFVVINVEFSARAEPGGAEQRFYAALADGTVPYKQAFEYKAEVPLSLLSYSPRFTANREDEFTNLAKVNPRIRVYRRVDTPG